MQTETTTEATMEQANDIGTWALDEHGEWQWTGLPTGRETTVSYCVWAAVEQSREAERAHEDFWAGINRQHMAHEHADGSECADGCGSDYGCA